MNICKVDGCENKVFGHGYCNKHYMQIRRHGQIQDITYYSPNEIIEYEDYAEIILRDKNCKEIAKTIIDLNDIDKVKDIKWYLHNDNHVRNGKVGYLHRYIMNCPDDMVIDHINRNPLDNRKANLRICTQHQNTMNRKSLNSNRGISKTSSGKYRARIHINKKEKHLGVFDTIEEAEKARRQAEIDYFGEFAPCLNDKDKGADLTDKRN